MKYLPTSSEYAPSAAKTQNKSGTGSAALAAHPGAADLLELRHGELTERLSALELAPYRARQIARWIYQRQADSFDVMTDLRKDLRLRLARAFCIRRLGRAAVQTSGDGTRKYLFELSDGNRVETVLIPERSHFTLCVSTQVGCAQGCRFCRTAAGGFLRHLTRGEIVAQVRDVLRDLAPEQRLTNLVFMGMGEPLANYGNLVSALETLTDGENGFGFASRRVTVSTVGLVPRIADLGRDAAVNLAVSLNAVNDTVRSQLMPVNRAYPIEALLAACRRFPLRSGRRITFEYVLIDGVNASDPDAEALARLLRPVKSKINLIAFNPHPGCTYRPPTEDRVLRFQEILLARHYTAVVRKSKGADISAACGQLRASAAAC